MPRIYRSLWLSVALPVCAWAQNFDAARLFKPDPAAVVMIISQESGLEKASPPDVSGEWRSPSSGNRFKVRLKEQHAYVEWLPAEEQTKLEFSELCDLKAEKDKYRGTCQLQAVIRWQDGKDHEWKSRVCRLNSHMELTSYSASRVEGRSETKGLGQKWSEKDNSNCGERFPVEWTDFVWIRPK